MNVRHLSILYVTTRLTLLDLEAAPSKRHTGITGRSWRKTQTMGFVKLEGHVKLQRKNVNQNSTTQLHFTTRKVLYIEEKYEDKLSSTTHWKEN